MSKIYRLFLLLPLFSFSWPLHAQPKDSKPLMYITADSSQYNYRMRETWFEGNIRLDQGETHLIADRLITKKNHQNKIQEALAFGLRQPAHYWAHHKNGKILQAYAKLMKFYPLESRIILEGDVLVTQGENRFQGQIIIYNIKLQTITVPPTKNSRATFVIDTKQTNKKLINI